MSWWRLRGRIREVVVVIGFVLALAHSAWAGSVCSRPSLDFDDLGISAEFRVGDAIPTGGFQLRVEPFFLETCGVSPFTDGVVRVIKVGGAQTCFEPGLALLVDTATVDLMPSDAQGIFDGDLDRVDIRVRHDDGNLSFEVNGDCRKVGDLLELSDQTVGGVGISVVETTPGCQLLRVQAEGLGFCCTSLKIGADQFTELTIERVDYCGDNGLRIGAAAGRQGEVVEVPMTVSLLEDAGEATFAVCHDPLRLELVEVVLGADAAARPRESFDIVTFPLGFSATVRFAPGSPLAGLRQEVFLARYRVLASGPDQVPLVPCTLDATGAPLSGLLQPDDDVLQIFIPDGGGRVDIVSAGPTFTLGFSTCDLEGPPGQPFARTVDCTLTTADNTTPDGAQGWSISVASDLVVITEITTDDTAGAMVPVGFRQDGFEVSAVTAGGVDECARHRSGAISAVVLSLTQPVTLPPDGTQVLARITIAGTFPDGVDAVSQARLLYADGCQPAGVPPTENAITFQGRTVAPVLGECTPLRLIGGAGLPEVCPRVLTCSVDQPTKLVTLSFTAAPNARELGLVRYDLFRDGQFIANIAPFRTVYVDQPLLGFATRDTPFAYRLVPVFTEDRTPMFDPDPASGCRALECVAVIAATAGVVFSESFDGFRSDDDLMQAGWRVRDEGEFAENASFTVTNPFGRRNPPGLTGRPTTGAFLISDSRGADGRNQVGTVVSHDILSPEFDASSLEVCWLHFDAGIQFDDDGTAVFDVDVSTNGGRSFATAFERVSPARMAPLMPAVNEFNADGFFGRIDVDITELAAGRPSVIVRFRHFEPSDDYWVAIDNVVVDDQPPPQATVPPPGVQPIGGPSGPLSMSLLDEQFGNGIPVDWEIRSFKLPVTKAGLTWNTTDPADRHTGSVQPLGLNRMQPLFSICDSLFIGPQPNAELMVTPVLNCSMFQEVFLVFDDEALLSVQDEALKAQLRQEVLLSIDGGVSFLDEAVGQEPIFRYDLDALAEQGENSVFQPRGFYVKGAAGQSRVAFAFRYEGPGETGWWGADRVRIYGTVREVVFRRGDVNGDGAVNISDVQGILTYLFNGASRPQCFAAADLRTPPEVDGCDVANFNDLPRVDVSFCINILMFLFRGGPQPPPPFRDCDQLRKCSDIRLGCDRSALNCTPME